MADESGRSSPVKLLDWLPVVMVIAGLIWDASATKEQTSGLRKDVDELVVDSKQHSQDIAALKARMEK